MYVSNLLTAKLNPKCKWAGFSKYLQRERELFMILKYLHTEVYSNTRVSNSLIIDYSFVDYINLYDYDTFR
jgi:hypothetical protein